MMSKKPVTPNRQKYLKAWIACLKRSENRIRAALAPSYRLSPRVAISEQEREIRARINTRMRERGMMSYAEALMCLRIKRSQCAIELESLHWEVKPHDRASETADNT